MTLPGVKTGRTLLDYGLQSTKRIGGGVLAVLVLIGAGGVLLSLACTDTGDRFSSFFETAGQVFVTLLVAVALDARFGEPEGSHERPLFVLTVGFIFLAEGASLIALGFELSDLLHRGAFVVGFGSGVVALAGVIVLVFRLLQRELAPGGSTSTLE